MRKRFVAGLVAAVTIAVVTASGCGTKPTGTDYAEQLKSKITVDAVMAHLQKLQDIADANDGTRVAGSPGYAASVQFVADTLRDKGFDVVTPEFDFEFFKVDKESLVVAGKPVEARAVEISNTSPPQGVTGPLVFAPQGEAPGCSSLDYEGLPVRGAVVVVDRGECYLDEKARIVARAGGVAVIIANNVDEETFSGYVAEEDDTTIPVLSVSQAVGAQLRTMSGEATVVLTAHMEKVKSNNVIAQTKTGATDNVVIVGAHLDSVREGPGINDNGSGVAAVLETALQMGNSPDVKNAVRFAFWGGEEAGLFGSRAYLKSLDDEALKDIALYLNFDMIASANACYFTSDGNQSAKPDFDLGLQLTPEGSAGIERTLVGALEQAGVTPEDKHFDGRSDYDSFTQAGIPVGNFDTGADEVKTPEQAEIWGGEADKMCDPNYHTATDTIANINRDALAKALPVIGYVTGLYAQNETGVNGVPSRDLRTRNTLPDD